MMALKVPWLTLPHLDVGLEHAARAEYELGVQAWNLRQPEQGLELFLRSAQKGYQVGEYCFRYGMYHELPPSDMIQAFRWYKRGARMNHKGSTTMLGKLHLAAGHRDLAVRFLRRTGLPLGVLGPAATEADVLERGHGGWRGDSLAQWFLGELFLQSAKLRDAVKWWKLSAENGDSDAMMRLSQVLSAAKLEIGVFLLAASLHFLLFSNPTLQRSLRSKSKINEPGPGAKEKTGPSVAIPAAVKQLVRSGAKKAPIEEEIRSLAAFHKVSADELQIILASALEGLGRLPAESELLGAVRALVPAVTSTRLAEQLLRAYLGARARAEFEGVLQEVETHCKSNNIKLPQGIAVLAMQFALGADNLEVGGG
ncbi:unnamed protein product [Effrenium voratum]|nr:unnamed protein product [Effrenium voratum]